MGAWNPDTVYPLHFPYFISVQKQDNDVAKYHIFPGVFCHYIRMNCFRSVVLHVDQYDCSLKVFGLSLQGKVVKLHDWKLYF